ncbi:MAG: hypothetical protein H6Q74_1783 [Firmicutes bacterium]|nr:hypothetical protein [Bacillota bacterium]
MRKYGLTGWALILVGVVFLLERIGIISWACSSYFWPLILIAVGIGIVVKQRNS